MKKKILFATITGLALLNSCNFDSLPPRTVTSELKRCLYIACEIILSKNVLDDKPAIVLIPTDLSLEAALEPIGLDLESFPNSPRSLTFARRHVLVGSVIQSGIYFDKEGNPRSIICASPDINTCEIEGRHLSIDYNSSPPNSIKNGAVVFISSPLPF